jgi:YYY domain-containing protein
MQRFNAIRLLAGLRSFQGYLPEFLTLGLTALTIGALWPTNTWDFPTYALLVGAALALAAYTRNQGRIDADTLLAVGWRWGVVLVLGFLFFKPFHDHSASAYFGAEQWKGSRTPLWAYLIVHGFFLFVLGSYLIHELTSRRGLGSPARLLGVAIRHTKRMQRLQRLYGRLVHPQPLHELIVVLAPAYAFGLLFLIAIGHAPEAIALLLAAMAGLVLCSPQPHPQRQFICVLIAAGALLTAIVEVVVLKGDISRMNTVFKFYLQVWVMWGIAAAAAMPALAERLGSKPIASTGVARPVKLLPIRWWRVFALLLAGCLLYPISAIPNRIMDRFEGVTAVTLDGMAYMRTATYTDQDQPIVLEYDREAIDWIRTNIPGLPTIVEANTPLYRWGSRVAIYSGLPTVIGWDWHQKQQRSVLPGEYIDRRIEDVKAIYSDPNPEVARRLLQRYNVEYIYVGKNERIYYAADGINKFAQQNGQFWDKVYENPEVQIYRVGNP